jgi:hypothetical protein
MSFLDRLRAYWFPSETVADFRLTIITLASQPMARPSTYEYRQLATLARRCIDGGGPAAFDDLCIAIDARPASAAPKVAMALVNALHNADKGRA